ncbi:alpha-ketoglutarate-dependent 2,4-dichlorophenoxyacetate dioxygenase [Decorospora gaudefroyi]|uniref:Alpha-ketoglutarate-dependent 2,4-dichlorophenoxyacetate dioxygenase n=1 Tax=Decorospora gaudefroyi TaxID=184978 RepID=A0A6A5K241_9PLEO|nr:alpha-ketoglutarate-dependent 2,4-dichlorophenoxyacetate dioxygenase [Decorospora gaudefroyi]
MAVNAQEKPGPSTGGSSFKTFRIKELHPNFGAEIEGVDFPNPSERQFRELLQAMAKYGVCIFRKTDLDDTAHVEFSRNFGELDDIRPYITGGRKMRYQHHELFDAGNVDEDGIIIHSRSPKAQYQKGNALFHVDSSFNPRRASYSLLRAFELPPPNNGGNTEFADSRTAFDELPIALKNELLEENYIAAHSLAHSRKKAAPMYQHKIVQLHEPSNRMNLYVGAHAHHIVGIPREESDQLLQTLLERIAQEKNCFSVAWKDVGDMIIWDNTCVLNRAGGGTFAGKHRRDLRRTTVHDASSMAWGLNDPGVAERPGFAPGFSNDTTVSFQTL